MRKTIDLTFEITMPVTFDITDDAATYDMPAYFELSPEFNQDAALDAVRLGIRKEVADYQRELAQQLGL